MMGMRRLSWFLCLMLLLSFVQPGMAAGIDTRLEEIYSALNITDGASSDELKQSLSVTIEENTRDAAVVDSVVYVLTEMGIHAVSMDETHTFTPFSQPEADESLALRRLFSNEGELWGLTFDWMKAFNCVMNGTSAEPEALNYCYGKIDLSSGCVRFTPVTQLNTDFYQSAMRMGLYEGRQIKPIAMAGTLYCIDIASLDEDGNPAFGLIACDLTSGEGREICQVRHLYDLTVFDSTHMLGISVDLLSYLHRILSRVDRSTGKSEMLIDDSLLGDAIDKSTLDSMQIPILSIDIQTGKQTVIAVLDANAVDMMTNFCGAPSGLVWDDAQEILYYGREGKLHALSLSDNLDTTVADLPSSWLRSTSEASSGFLTADNHYISIAPGFGVDIVDLN